MRRNREEDFRAGLEILEPFLAELDFALKVLPATRAAEGTCYSALFVWGNHAVTLTHLFGLDSVTYSVGMMSVEHTRYLDALGVREGAGFPVTADDPLAGYHALLGDLESRLMPFFEEPDREFMDIAAIWGQRRRPAATG